MIGKHQHLMDVSPDLSIFCISPKAKQYFFSKAFDKFYKSLVKTKNINESKWNYHILYSVRVSIIVFFYSSEPGIVPQYRTML